MTIQLNQEQQQALAFILDFLQDDAQDVLILRGSAGTGKTTLIAEVVQQIHSMNKSVQLMAPTARAARVLTVKLAARDDEENKAFCSTLHSCIYSEPRLELDEEKSREEFELQAEEVQDELHQYFPLKTQEPSWQIAIVDEASMLGDLEQKQTTLQFGSGRVLHDLLRYTRLSSARTDGEIRRKLIFVGDHNQLPPVKEPSSLALDAEYLREKYGLQVCEIGLNQVMRQADGSRILDVASRLRDALGYDWHVAPPLPDEADGLSYLSSKDAVTYYVGLYRDRKVTSIVTHSNGKALGYNTAIRKQLWGEAAPELVRGELLLINQNCQLYGMSNGDLVKTRELSPRSENVTIRLQKGGPVTLRFRDVTLVYRQASGEIAEKNCKILENLLDREGNILVRNERIALLVHFCNRHKDLDKKSRAFMRTLMDDPYYNALRVKYGYAMTCHKAQGGEWEEIIVDLPHWFDGRHSTTHFRWVYTAITRAKKRLCMVNAENFFSGPDSIQAKLRRIEGLFNL